MAYQSPITNLKSLTSLPLGLILPHKITKDRESKCVIFILSGDAPFEIFDLRESGSVVVNIGEGVRLCKNLPGSNNVT